MNSLIKRANDYHKKYAVALNDLDLSYTQKWYSSAIIYDTEKRKYIVAGSIWNQFNDKIDDLEYIEDAQYVDICMNNFDNFVQRIIFQKDSTLEEKKILIYHLINCYDLQENITYFIAEVEHVPSLIMADNQNSGEWLSGTSLERNRLIFLNSGGNKELLYNAKQLSSNSIDADIIDVFAEGDFIYVDLETDQIMEYSYPNTIRIIYEED